METLEQYEARMGLTVKDRGIMPEMGYLGAVPQTKVHRPTLLVLGEEVLAEDVTITVSATEIAVAAPSQSAATVASTEVKKEKAVPVIAMDEDDVIGVNPVRRPVKPQAGDITPETLTQGYVAATPPPPKPVEVVKAPEGIPELIEMDELAMRKLQKALGVGRKKITVRYQGKTFTIPDVEVETIPSEYVKSR
jgi:hypothetical protein